MARHRAEVPYIILTNGRFDKFVGNKLALPVLKKIAYLMSARTFARVSIYGVCLACGVFSLTQLAMSGDWTYLIGLLCSGSWFFFYWADLRRFERLYGELQNDNILNLKLLRTVESLASIRTFWPVLAGILSVLDLVTGSNYPGVLIVLLLYSVVILGYYAATCVMPRRKIKSLARAKAWWQRATAPRPVLRPTKAGV